MAVGPPRTHSEWEFLLGGIRPHVAVMSSLLEIVRKSRQREAYSTVARAIDPKPGRPPKDWYSGHEDR